MDLQIKLHPKGLLVCSVTEALERLGFFAVQSILILYLIQYLKLSDKQAYYLYTAISGLSYASPVIGGILADKILNFKKAVFLGLCLFVLGYFLLISHNTRLVFTAFALQIVGNGFVKGNITSLLGRQYKDNDIRRDSGFTLFYLGMNVGQILGPILSSVALKYYGFSAAFVVCSISSLTSLLIFYLGKGSFQDDIKTSNKESKAFSFLVFYALLVVVTIVIGALLIYPVIINFSIAIISLLSLLYLVYMAIMAENKTDMKKLFVIMILFIFSALFWALFMQTFTSLLLFANRNVDLSFFGILLPTPILISFQAVALVILAPFFSLLWLKLGNGKWQPSFGLKFSYGFLFLALAYMTIVLAIHFFSVNSRINVGWVLIAFALLAVAELFLSAIGLSAISRLAPKKHLGMIMGFWFLTISAGFELGNKLDVLAYVPHTITLASKMLLIYKGAFFDFMIIAAVLFIASFLIVPTLKKMSLED